MLFLRPNSGDWQNQAPRFCLYHQDIDLARFCRYHPDIDLARFYLYHQDIDLERPRGGNPEDYAASPAHWSRQSLVDRLGDHGPLLVIWRRERPRARILVYDRPPGRYSNCWARTSRRYQCRAGRAHSGSVPSWYVRLPLPGTETMQVSEVELGVTAFPFRQ